MANIFSKILKKKTSENRTYKLDRIHISPIKNGSTTISIDLYQDRFMTDFDIWNSFQIDLLIELLKNFHLVVCQNMKFYTYPPNNIQFFGEYFEEYHDELEWETGDIRFIGFNTSDISLKNLKEEIKRCNDGNHFYPIGDDFPGYAAELLPCGDNLSVKIHTNTKIISDEKLLQIISKILNKYKLKAAQEVRAYDGSENINHYIQELAKQYEE